MRIVFFSLLLAFGAGCLQSNARAEVRIEDYISDFIDVAVGQQPGDENGTKSEFEFKALNDKSNSDIYDSTSQQIIERSGYRQQSYQVISDDGYLTQLIRIINPSANKAHLKRPPVMLFHGGLIDTTSWIWADAIQHHPEKYPRNYTEDGPITSSNRSLAFVLANFGFDVWLVGTRGSNRQNLGHVKYRPKLLEDFLADFLEGRTTIEGSVRSFVDTLKYFDYSMDELVELEVPRQIETVLGITESNKVSVVGLSFSTTILFKILTSNKALANKIHSYAALVPLLNANGANRLVRAVIEIAPKIPEPIGVMLTELILSKLVRDILRKLPRYTVYKKILTLVAGSSAKYQTDLSDPIVGHTFLSTGWKEIQHYCQETKAGKLQKFDYGPQRNVYIYGSYTPAVYDLSEFELKRWMLVSAANDVLGTPNSADEYVKQIRTKPYKALKIDRFDHWDGFAAFNNDIEVNLPILEFFEEFKMSNVVSEQQQPEQQADEDSHSYYDRQ